MSTPTITLLAGGVGGAKAAEGLAASRYAERAAVIGNVGDDDRFHGLWVSPDIDTLIYSLANEIDRDRGWGRKAESYRLQQEFAAYGLETWMTLGDLDLATHVFRSQALAKGETPSAITQKIAQRFQVALPILLPTNDVVQTQIQVDGQWQSFQSFFVKAQCKPEIDDIRYQGANEANPIADTLQRIQQSDIILLAPSNPIVSIGAILAVPGIRDAIAQSTAYVMAISPLINGTTVKGPADKMMTAMGFSANNQGIADCYADLLNGLVIDSGDCNDHEGLQKAGLDVVAMPTLMTSLQDKTRVIEAALDSALTFNNREVA